MSIYSGFPTRRDEQRYNSLLSKLITALQNHLISLLPPKDTTVPSLPDKQTRTYSKILSRMKDYEEHKYLPPKFSTLLEPLCKALGIQQILEQRIVPVLQEAEWSPEHVKASSRSLHKPKFNAGLSEIPSENAKRGNLRMGNKNQEQGRSPSTHVLITPQRQLFQSVSSKLSRPKTLKGIFPAQHKVQLSQQYEQPIQQQWESVRGRIASNESGSKAQGGRMRYRAFQALQEAQSHLSRRQVPLREEMRRKLKTEQGGGREIL